MFEPMIGKEPKGLRKIYLDKYALWTQLVGCICLFGSFFVFILEHNWFGAHHHYLSIPMLIIGVILCTVNWAVSDV